MAKMKVAVVKKACPMGQHRMPDGKCMKDSAMPKKGAMGGKMAPPFKRISGS